MKVLVVNLCELGDLLFSTPMLDALGAQGHELHYLTDQACAPAVEGHPSLRRCWTLPRRDWSLRLALPQERPAALAQALAWAEALREERFDTVYCLQPVLTSVTLARLAGGRNERGFTLEQGSVHLGEGGELLARHLRQFENRGDDGLHAAEGYLSLLPRGQWPEQGKLTYAIPAAARLRAEGLLAGPGRCVAILPGAGSPHKRWGIGAWRALLRGWHRCFPEDRIWVLGGGDDAERGRLLARAPGTTDLCGRLNFGESAAVLSRCAAAVGGDTGPLHLAAAVGTPCLGLFGSTYPSESGPLLKAGLALKPGSGRLDDLEAAPVLRALAGLLAGESSFRLRGAETWPGREAEGARIRAAWASASMRPWMERQTEADETRSLEDLAQDLIKKSRLGLESLQGPSLALANAYFSLTHRLFSDELP